MIHNPRTAVLAAALLWSSTTAAMPLDNFLSVDPAGSAPHRLTIELSQDLATDEVAHAPNAAGGGYLPAENRRRYQGRHLVFRIRLGERLRFDGGLWEREITSLRDRFDLQSFHAALQYELPTGFEHTRLAIRAGLWSNRSDRLDKNSYTRQSGYLFTATSIESPSDRQLQLNLIGSRRLGGHLSVNAFTGIGSSVVDFAALSATVRARDACRYRFDYDGSAAEIRQLEQCGPVSPFRLTLPNEASIEERLDFSPRQELAYRASYWQLGGSIEWRQGRWNTALGYRFQRYDRGALDERVRARDRKPAISSHNLQLDIDFRVADGLGLFLRSEYMSHRLLDMVPFAYNGYTADKFGQSGLLFNTGLRLYF